MKTTIMAPCKERIYANSVADSQMWKNKLECATQQGLKFKPKKLRETIESLLEGPIMFQHCSNSKPDTSGKVVVLAGFTADYSCGLRDAGFNVIHTDLCDNFIDLGRKKGLKSMKAHAENPPKFDDTCFYTSFEFGPIHTSVSTEILMLLNTLTYSRYGFIETSLWDSTLTWDHLRAIYNFDSTIWKVPVAVDAGGCDTKVYVVRYYMPKEQKSILKTDLKVIGALNEIKDDSIEFYKLTALAQTTKATLVESLERINAAMHTKNLDNEKTRGTIKEIKIV